MGGYSDKDTAKETGSSIKEAREGGHKARDDAEKSGDFKRGDSEKNSSRFSRSDSAGKSAGGFGDSFFGSKK